MKVEVLCPEVTKIATRTRIEGEDGLVTTIQFCAKLPPTPIARLLNMQRQGVSLYAIIGSNQTLLDLDVQERKETEVKTFPL